MKTITQEELYKVIDANYLWHTTDGKAVVRPDGQPGGRADLSYHDLSGMDLSKSEKCTGDLMGANMSHSNLTGANLDGTNFEYADLTGVIGIERTA